MKNIIHICFLITILFLFNEAACSDYAENLGNGYIYMHEEKGNNFIYHEFPLKGGKIPRDVISFDYDKEFIIVKQKLMPRVAGEKEINYKYRDSIFYYWLIE